VNAAFTDADGCKHFRLSGAVRRVAAKGSVIIALQIYTPRVAMVAA